jgi:DNA-binding XRE family transcriptional regulator
VRNRANRIAEHRERKGLTQEAVAREAGIGLRSFQAIEGGTQQPKIKTAVAIAAALGVRLDILFPVDGQG